MFAAVIKIQDFQRRLPAILLEVQPMRRHRPKVQGLPGAPQPFTQSAPIDQQPSSPRLVLPVDQLVDQQAASRFCVALIPPGDRTPPASIRAIPRGLSGFFACPTPDPGSATGSHRPSTRPACWRTPLGHAFHGRLLIPALRLRFSAHTHPLHQGVERRVINGLRPAAGHLRRLLIRTSGRYGKTQSFSANPGVSF